MWKKVQVNIQNIKHETAKAVLFACPHNSKYDGYVFWHPSKLVRDGKHSYAVSVSYTDEFEFRLKKYGSGKYNSNQVLDEKTISAEEFEKMFGTINENISPKKPHNEFECHVPNEKNPIKAEIEAELKDE